MTKKKKADDEEQLPQGKTCGPPKKNSRATKVGPHARKSVRSKTRSR